MRCRMTRRTARPLPSRIVRRLLSWRRCMVPAICERGPRPSLCGDVFTGSLSRVGTRGVSRPLSQRAIRLVVSPSGSR
jgi:hypothetical protein